MPTKMAHPVDLIVVAAYMLFLICLGVWVAKRRKENILDSYLVSGRNIGHARMISTMAATDIGGGFSIGLAGLGFTMGFAGSWMLFASGLGALLAGIFLVPKARKFSNAFRAYTYPQFLGKRFGENTRFVASLLVGLAWWSFVGGQVIAGAKLAQVVLGLDLTTAILIVGGVVVFYTAMGGLEAVVWTDLAQFLILVVGVFLLALPLGLMRVGGFTGLREVLPAELFNLGNISGTTFWAWFLAITPIWFISMAGYQRIYAAKDDSVARVGFYATAFIEWPLMGLLGTLMGLLARASFPDIEAELAMPTMIVNTLPIGIAGIVIAAYLSAVMSTADSCLMVPVANVVEDIYHARINPNASEDRLVKLGQWTTLVLGILAIVLAYRVPRIIDLILYAYTFGAAGLFFPTLAALFWKRATGTGAMLGIGLGGLVAVIWSLAGSPYGIDPIFLGMPVSLAALVVGSLATSHSEEEDLRTFY